MKERETDIFRESGRGRKTVIWKEGERDGKRE